MKRLSDFVLRRHQPDHVALSAHVDGRLAAPAAEALASHLATCADCRARLDELRQVRERLRAMPAAEAPRSFRITRAMVDAASARPAPQQGPPAFVRVAPALGAGAAIVFAVLVAVDVSSSGGGTGAKSLARPAAEAPSAAQRADTSIAAGAAAPAATGAAPAATPTPAVAAAPGGGVQPPVPAAPTGTPGTADSSRASAPTPSGNSALSSQEQAADGQRGGTSSARVALRVAEALVAALAIGAAGVVIGRRLRGRGASR